MINFNGDNFDTYYNFHAIRIVSSTLHWTNWRFPVHNKQYVDKDFGTGALKITPGHDPNDYAIGKKLGLPFINIFNKDATLNENAGDYWYIIPILGTALTSKGPRSPNWASCFL